MHYVILSIVVPKKNVYTLLYEFKINPSSKKRVSVIFEVRTWLNWFGKKI
jgi:hypothetical protein